jgi:streptogramin lyase
MAASSSGEFRLLKAPEGYMTNVVVGPDGNFWYPATHGNIYGYIEIVRFTPSGIATSYKVPGGLIPSSVAAGSDGNVWFGTYECTIGSITPSGLIHLYKVRMSTCETIVGSGSGAGAAVWFSDSDYTDDTKYSNVGYITAAGAITQFPLPKGYTLGTGGHITLGADRNMWFTAANGYVGRVAPNGTFKFFLDPEYGGLTDIVTGPDGYLWFLAYGDYVVEMNTSGKVLKTFLLPGSVFYLTAAKDGKIWATGYIGLSSSPGLFEITASGAQSQHLLPAAEAKVYEPVGITVGPDSQIWFSTSFILGVASGSNKGMGTFVP